MISKIIRSNSSSNLIKYIFKDHAHDTSITNERYLACGATNVANGCYDIFDPDYARAQFWAVQQKAKNKHKKTKAYHMIFSFSEKDFPLPKDKTDLTKQAIQAGKLVQDFLRKDLPKDAQFVLGVQRDGKGHMLHVHVALNSVKLSGKVLNTNGIRLVDKGKQLGLRSRMDNYLEESFQKVTGRSYKPVEAQNENLVKSTEWHVKDREGAKNAPRQAYSWKEHLKSLIYDAFSASHDLTSFKDACLQNGIKIKTRRASIGKGANGKKIYREAYTYSFTGEDGKSHSSRDFAYTKTGGVRGLGKSFAPEAIEKEFENALNRQKQRLQEVAITTLRQLTTRVGESNWKSVQTAATTTEASSSADRTRRSPKASKPAVKASIGRLNTVDEADQPVNDRSAEITDADEYDIFSTLDYQGFRRASAELANNNQPAKNADKSVNNEKDGQSGEDYQDKVTKPDLSALANVRTFARQYRKEVGDYRQSSKNANRDRERKYASDQRPINNASNDSAIIRSANAKNPSTKNLRSPETPEGLDPEADWF